MTRRAVHSAAAPNTPMNARPVHSAAAQSADGGTAGGGGAGAGTSGAEPPGGGQPSTEQLLQLLSSKQRLLVLTHTNPDPDSIASAFGLLELAQNRFGMDGAFGITGRIMRAENREMVKQLEVPSVPLAQLDLDSFDVVAVVDAQPGFGHTTIPEGLLVDIVVDHHQADESCEGMGIPFRDIRLDLGATSSIVTGYLRDAGVEVGPDLATALAYGIRTDTADLSRNVSSLDKSSYEFLLSRIDRVKLAAITNPRLPEDYFSALKQGLKNVRIYDHVAVSSLDKTASPEMVAEVADMLLRHEGVSEVFVGGLVGTTYHISVRTEVGGRSAWRFLRDAVGDEGSYGGHGAVAGGSIELPDNTPRTLARLERRLVRGIRRSCGVEDVAVHRIR